MLSDTSLTPYNRFYAVCITEVYLLSVYPMLKIDVLVVKRFLEKMLLDNQASSFHTKGSFKMY